MNNIFLHIGYPKCASTFLQKEIFYKDKNINYLNYDRFNKYQIFWKHVYGSNKTFFLKNYKKDLKFLTKLNFNYVNILSSEDITDFVKLKDVYKIDIENVIKRLKIISDYFKIKFKFIITIREQKQLIMSRYAQDNCFVNLIPKYKNFDEIKKFFKKKNKKGLEKKIFDSFDFYLIYKNINKFFKSDDIKILTFEDLSFKKKSFFKKLYEFLKIKTNKDLPAKNNYYNQSFKNNFENIYYRKLDQKGKKITGTLNRITRYIPLKEMIFKTFNSNFKNKIKIFFLELDRNIMKYDQIKIKHDELKYIYKYYKKNNQKLSKIINSNISKYNN